MVSSLNHLKIRSCRVAIKVMKKQENIQLWRLKNQKYSTPRIT